MRRLLPTLLFLLASFAFTVPALAKPKPPKPSRNVPELSVNASAGALLLVAGGLMVMGGRRRRAARRDDHRS